jgi:hypothetical protein
MRIFQLLVGALAIAAAYWVGAKATRAALEPTAPPQATAGTSAVTPSAGAGLAFDRSPDRPAVLAGNEAFTPAEREQVLTCLRGWELSDEALAGRCSELLAAAAATHPGMVPAPDLKLAVDWILRRHIQTRHGGGGAAAAPADVQVVRLANDRLLHATSARRTDAGIELQLVFGGTVTLRPERIQSTEAITAADYWRQYSAQFDREAETTRPDQTWQLETAMGTALSWGDTARASQLYDRWLRGPGPARLSASFPLHVRRLLRNSFQALGIAGDGRVAPDAAATPAVPAAPTVKRNDTVIPPSSVAQLEKLIAAARLAVGERPEGARRTRLQEELMTYEDWLERSPEARALPAGRLDQLRRELQLLRLDLLKSSGF